MDVHNVTLPIFFMFEKSHNEILGKKSNAACLLREAVGYQDALFTYIALVFGQSWMFFCV